MQQKSHSIPYFSPHAQIIKNNTIVIVSPSYFKTDAALLELLRVCQLNFNIFTSNQIVLEQMEKHLKLSLRSYTIRSQPIKGSKYKIGIPPFVFKALNPIKSSILFGSQKQQIQYSEELKKRKIESCLPEQFLNRLYQFQKQGIEFGIQNCGRILFGDEMGIGKTIQALGLATVYKESWPVVIICPSSLMLNWRDECISWLLINQDDIQVIRKQKDTLKPGVKIYITSYDLATHHTSAFRQQKLQIGIVDEAHNLKGLGSKRSKLLVPFLMALKHILLLTGTPALAKPKELFNILQILRPDIFKNFFHFANRYCDPKPSRYTNGMDYDGCSHPGELNWILQNSLMIRRLKKDVLDQLPSKIRQNICIEVDKSIQKQIHAIINQNSSFSQFFMELDQNLDIQQDQNNKKQNSLALVSKCYYLTGMAKLNGICQTLLEIVEDYDAEKFIVFAHHKDVMDGIEKFFKSKKINNLRIDGDTKLEQRHERVQFFQHDKDIRVIILSLTAASTGITLTASSTVVFAELNWTPGTMHQAEDRAHRLGQKDCVNCLYLLGPDTLDDKIMQALTKKIQTVEAILNDNEKEQFQSSLVDQMRQTQHSQAKKSGHKQTKIDQFFKKKESPVQIQKTNSELMTQFDDQNIEEIFNLIEQQELSRKKAKIFEAVQDMLNE